MKVPLSSDVFVLLRLSGGDYLPVRIFAEVPDSVCVCLTYEGEGGLGSYGHRAPVSELRGSEQSCHGQLSSH